MADRYHIEHELGAGGMATVFLAEDIKHHRKVAIKVLHAELSAILGPERFLKEIELTASLQHPHILPLFDSGSADGLLYYVMPYVDGETLRTRIERERQLSVRDATRIAAEVADALGYAHRRGVLHRDIKPENILLHDGRALVADFGIALAVAQAGGTRMTQTGLSLGTPQYMSPEQAIGERNIDARTDIYALGAVTYEMLAGDPPFTGSSVQAIIARVMTERPTPIHTLRDTVPPGVENAVLTALAKLPADRFATAAEFASALTSNDTVAQHYTPGVSSGRVSTRAAFTRALPWALAAMAILVAGWSLLRRSGADTAVTRVAVALPAGQEMQPQFAGFNLDISRDGTRLAYIGRGPTDGSTQVWVRPLNELDGAPVAGTVGAATVRWSADGRSLLVMLGKRASVVSLDGGQSAPLPGATDGMWGMPGGVYSPDRGTIVRQNVGGTLDTVLALDTSFTIGTLTVLPGEHAALFSRLRNNASLATAGSEIAAVSFKTRRVVALGPGVFAQFLPPDHLLRVDVDGNASVSPFDADAFRVTGPSIPVARVATGQNTGRGLVVYPQISVSDNGTLVYISGAVQRERLTWLDAHGRSNGQLDVEGDLWGVSLSPDGSHVAYSRFHGESESGFGTNVWAADLTTGVQTQLTSSLMNMRPSWSPDGRYVLWARVGGPSRQALMERRADASEPERTVLTSSALGHSLGGGHWLPDHRTLLVSTYLDAGSRNTFSITPGVDSAPHVIAATAANEIDPVPSPDGTVVAYLSDESGVRELYVQTFPVSGGHVAVSHGGAGGGRWSRDGHQLYFWDQRGKLMVATISAHPALAVASVREIGSDVTPATGGGQTTAMFDVAPDGRILVATQIPGSFDLILVRNWLAGLAPPPAR
jgi:serine/threonine-protein kinase